MNGVSLLFFQTVDGLGQRLIRIIAYTAHLAAMTYLSVRATLFDQAQGLRTVFSVISAQIFFTGWQALPLISMLSLAVGSIIIMQSTAQLSLFGNMDFIGRLLVVIVVRELGPLVTALVVIARSGTAVASELGNMRVNREIEALESMGIHPMSYIIFPRLLGGMVSVLCLAFYFNVIAILGGFVVTSFVHHLSFAIYTDALAQALTGQDVVLFFLKNSFSGLIIFLVSCDQGLSVEKSSHEVPQVTTKAVVNSIIYVVAFNLTVTTAYYFGELVRLGVI
jgi:phospholipid/cholesterol/gamma-HCH transport system permease protein